MIVSSQSSESFDHEQNLRVMIAQEVVNSGYSEFESLPFHLLFDLVSFKLEQVGIHLRDNLQDTKCKKGIYQILLEALIQHGMVSSCPSNLAMDLLKS